MTTFQAFWVEKNDAGVSRSVIERNTDELPEGEVLIRVAYSSVNYKDAMSANGLPGVTRNYPHTPGIDAAGVIAESAVPDLREGDEVIVIGFDLGMNTPGGFGEYIRVPAGWVVKMPPGLTTRDAMVLGTAGFTAALCVEKLIVMGATAADGPVLVTGASGGVGSVAVALLARLGYEVIASSGKADKAEYLKSLGANAVIGREVLGSENKRPLLGTDYAHGVDTVGGDTLSNLLKSVKYGGSVAACGLVASPMFPASVFPFILRSVNLLGIDSVELPLEHKRDTWGKLAGDWHLDNLDSMVNEVGLPELGEVCDAILEGKVSGRTLVKHQ